MENKTDVLILAIMQYNSVILQLYNINNIIKFQLISDFRHEYGDVIARDADYRFKKNKNL